jgi:DNA ligase (NAD+)
MLDLLIGEVKDKSLEKYLIDIRDSYEQLENIIQKIDEYDIAYFIESKPLVDDSHYDTIKRQMIALMEDIRRQIKVVEKLSLSEGDRQSIKGVFDEIKRRMKRREAKVGAKPSRQFKKVKHIRPMLSLSNCFTDQDLEKFVNRINYENNIVCELKIDGVSFSALYEDGKLKIALTRGDGEFGEDITLNVKQINNIPLEISYKNKLEIRGEIYIDKETFSRLSGFSNPRNAASGSIRQLDPNITRERNLKYFVWDADFKEIHSHYERLNIAKKLGFSTNEHMLLVDSLQSMIEFYREIQLKRSELSYDIDGIVYKVDNIAAQESLGYTGNGPRWATAYKFAASEAITKINDIIIQIGKSGVLTPVAVLEPVNIDGAIISRATLHNSSELQRRGYNIGDIVKVVRAGDVIPKIDSIVKKNATDSSFDMPKKCPYCSSEVVYDNSFTHKVCTGGISCKGQLIERLKHFVSRGAFNIIGLGDKQIEYFVNNSIINSYIDIFELEEKNTINLLQNRDGWGTKSTSELFKSINSCRKIELGKLLYSLSIPHVGVEIANLLAKNFVTYENLVNALDSKENYQLLIEINGIGHQIATAIIQFFSDKYNIELLEKLLLKIEIINHEVAKDSCYIYSLTGTLDSMTRSQAIETIKSHGGTYSATVAKRVNYLVVGSDPSQSKIDKARSLNIRILGEKEFLNIINRT